MTKIGIDLDYNILFGDWKWGNDQRYAYATGFLRSIEKRLITPDRFVRLAEARGIEEIFSMLGDTDYAKSYQEDIGALYAFDVNLILKEEEERVKGIIDKLTHDKEITDLLFLRNDFFNLKLALKEIYGEKEQGKVYSSLGLISPVTIFQEAKDPEMSKELPYFLKAAAVEAKGVYEDSKSPMDIDLIIDRAMYKYIIEKVKDAKLLFFYKLLTLEVDTTNILTFFRARWLDEPQSVFNQGFIEDGGIPIEFFADLYPRELEGIETIFSNTEYSDFVGEGVPCLKSENSFFRFEALLFNEFLRVIEKTKLLNFGIEILQSYFYLKVMEIMKLRTVFIAKENNLSPHDVKKRLGYV